MVKVILTTLLCTLLGSLFSFFLFFAKTDAAMYGTIMVFGSITIPTLIGVLLFQLIKSHFKLNSILIRIASLLVLFIIGIIAWIIIDTISSGFSWKVMKEDYQSQFAGFMFIGIFIAVIMPFIDIGLDKLLKKRKVDS